MTDWLGSKWTALETTFGWRHFRAMQKRRKGKDTYLLMTATCEETTQFWVSIVDFSLGGVLLLAANVESLVCLCSVIYQHDSKLAEDSVIY